MQGCHNLSTILSQPINNLVIEGVTWLHHACDNYVICVWVSKENLVEGFDYCISKENSFCEPCLKGKLQRNQFPAHSERKTSKPLELIHSDVCGKISSKSLSGAEYFVTFTDDKTRYIWVYPIKRKSDVFQKFKEWKTDVEKSLGQSVKIFCSDNGGEFTSTEFEEYLKKEGIKHELTIPKCPEQNGVAERLNRTLIEMVRSMLADSELPISFLAEALSTATYLRNCSPIPLFQEELHMKLSIVKNQKLNILESLVVQLIRIFLKMRGVNWMPRPASASFYGIPSTERDTDCTTKKASKLFIVEM